MSENSSKTVLLDPKKDKNDEIPIILPSIINTKASIGLSSQILEEMNLADPDDAARIIKENANGGDK